MLWVLLPGLHGTRDLFDPLISALPSKVEVFAVEYPNKACSADELTDVARGSLPGDEPYVLIAESFSGPIALRIAASKENPPAALVLCASFASCPRHRSFMTAVRALSRVAGKWKPPRWAARFWLLGDAPEEIVARFEETVSEIPGAVMAKRLRVLSDFDAAFAPERINCPLLILRAMRDRLVGAHATHELMRRYPTATLVQIDSPHLLLQIQPEAAMAAIEKFLSGIGAN